MSDISMCMNENCKNKQQCYRYTAEPNLYRQSYAIFQPDDNGSCEYYMNNGD